MRHIIYLPGLDGTFTDTRLPSFAERFMNALDVNDKQAERRFLLRLTKATMAGDQEVELAHIYEVRGQEEVETHRFHSFDYRKRLVDPIQQRSVAGRAFMLVFALVVKLPRILYLLFLPVGRTSLLRGARFQVGYVALVLVVFGLFGLILLSSLLSMVGEFFLSNNDNAIALLIKHVWHWMDRLLFGLPNDLYAFATYGVTLSAAMYLLLPRLQTTVVSLATDFLSLIYYFEHGSRRLDLVGGFERLVEYIAEQAEPESKIDVYAYSFGSLITLDVLFPRSGKVALRVSDRVTRLVTIGCPFDFINTYWPKYYKNRSTSAVKLEEWINVYSSIDVLGSNFRFDAIAADGEVQIAKDSPRPINVLYDQENVESIGFIQYMMMLGVTSHASAYWDKDLGSSSCLNEVVVRMEHKV